MDNTNGVIREIEYGSPGVVAELTTLLGPRFILPRAGVIRPGIMALKNGCSEKDIHTYEALVREGRDWDEIDREIKPDGNGKSKLIPRNVDYFAVHPKDCKRKDDARRILELYADPDGKLRSFPVVFPVNEWWNVIPHSLRSFGAGGLKFKSDFKSTNGGTGVERVCKSPVDAEPGKRVFGGRKWDERPCNPDSCAEYQKGECKFGGVIQFYIPGIKGIGTWLLPTTSWYSLLNVKSALETVSRITGGKIAGVFNGKPIFRLKKTKDKVSRIDMKTGRPVKTEQWLINLEVDVDITELAAYYESSKVLTRGEAATRLLSLPPSPPTETEPDGISKTMPEAGENAEPESKSPETEISANPNGNGSCSQKLIGNALLLWQAISKMHKGNVQRKKELKRLTGIDSFYSLTDEEAGKALECLAKETLNRF